MFHNIAEKEERKITNESAVRLNREQMENFSRELYNVSNRALLCQRCKCMQKINLLKNERLTSEQYIIR